jgi:hypothetical protein
MPGSVVSGKMCIYYFTVDDLRRRTVNNIRPDNIHNKDNINLHQILGYADDEAAAKCRDVASHVYNLVAKLT